MVLESKRDKSGQQWRNNQLLSRQLYYDSLFKTSKVKPANLPDCCKDFLVITTNTQNPAPALKISMLVYLDVISKATYISSDKPITLLLNQGMFPVQTSKLHPHFSMEALLLEEKIHMILAYHLRK